MNIRFLSCLFLFHKVGCFQTNTGFSDVTQYQVQNIFTCDFRFINQTFGILTSPNFPLTYPNDTKCIWNIEMAKDERIVVTIKTFVLALGDVLVIHNGDKKTSYSLGYPPNNVIYSSGNKMTIELKSAGRFQTATNSLTMEGNYSFYAEFEKEGCGGFFTGESGYIQVPSYIYLSRAPHECAWTILSPINKVIVLEFLQFDLPPGSCLYSNVYIREGDQSGGYVLGDFCEENPPLNQLRTASNIMYIAYRTRPNLLSSVLQMTPMLRMYYEIVDTCGGVLNGFSGSFATPRRWLDGRYVCNWTISIPEKKHILIKFDSWKVKNASEDEYDELKIVIPGRNFIFWQSKGDILPPESLIIPSNEAVVFLESHRNITSTVKLSVHGIYQAINMHDKRCINVGHKSLFMCDEWRYIECSLRCDGIIDCENGVDERFCPITSLDTIVMQHLHHRDQNKRTFTFLFYIMLGVAVLIIFLFFTFSRAYFMKKESKRPTSQIPFNLPPPYTELPSQSSTSHNTPLPPPYSEGNSRKFSSRKRRASPGGIPARNRYRTDTLANRGSPEYEYSTASARENDQIGTANLRYYSEEELNKMNIRRKSLSPKSKRKSLNEKFILNLPNLTEESTITESSKSSTTEMGRNLPNETLRNSVSDNSFAFGKVHSKDSSAELRAAEIRSMPDLRKAFSNTTLLTGRDDPLDMPDEMPEICPSDENQTSTSDEGSSSESENDENKCETEMFHNTDILERSSEYYSTSSLESSMSSNNEITESKTSPEEQNITRITSPSTSTWSRGPSPCFDIFNEYDDEPSLSETFETPTLAITSTVDNTLSPDSINVRDEDISEETPPMLSPEDSLECSRDLNENPSLEIETTEI